MGRFNAAVHDTTPGGESVFAPPRGWNGDREGYLALMRERFDNRGTAQVMLSAVRFFAREPERVEIVGPWRDEVLKILNKLS